MLIIAALVTLNLVNAVENDIDGVKEDALLRWGVRRGLGRRGLWDRRGRGGRRGLWGRRRGWRLYDDDDDESLEDADFGRWSRGPRKSNRRLCRSDAMRKECNDVC